MLDKDIQLITLAYRLAESSPDNSSQNGAVLVDSSFNILCTAINEFPKNVKYTNERWERPLKYSYIEHAERNIVFKAAQLGIATKNTILYCPWFACADCGRAIIQAGIKEVVGHLLSNQDEHNYWKDSIAIALNMFDESGVKYRWITEKIGGIKILRNGKIIEP